MTQQQQYQHSSVSYLFFSTSPFLILFGYFIYLAYERPLRPVYNLDDINDDYVIQEILNDPYHEISLMELLISFSSFFALWSILVVYLALFVRKRRDLIMGYVQKDSGAIEVLGNVYFKNPSSSYKNCCGRCINADYAYVSYEYPIFDDETSTSTTSTGTTDKKAASKEGRRKKGVDKIVFYHQMMIEKQVRTYHPHHREGVSIIILPNLPFSGQPRADVEMDVKTHQNSTYAKRNQHRATNVIFLCFFWMMFTLCGAIYSVTQMEKIRYKDFGEDPIEGWKVFSLIVGIITPTLALGGNYTVWWRYRRWVTKRGNATSKVKRVIPTQVDEIEFVDVEQGGLFDGWCGDNNKGSETDYKEMI